MVDDFCVKASEDYLTLDEKKADMTKRFKEIANDVVTVTASS